MDRFQKNMTDRVAALQEYKRKREERETRSLEPTDGDDLDLTVLVNDYWKKASFGYPIQ